MVTDPAETSGPFEAVQLQRGLPFVSAVEAEGYELQLSLISDGGGQSCFFAQDSKSWKATSGNSRRSAARSTATFYELLARATPILIVWLQIN
jgi:hypothetical protein